MKTEEKQKKLLEKLSQDDFTIKKMGILDTEKDKITNKPMEGLDMSVLVKEEVETRQNIPVSDDSFVQQLMDVVRFYEECGGKVSLLEYLTWKNGK